MREHAHAVHDVADPTHPLEGAADGARQPLQDEVVVLLLGLALELAADFRHGLFAVEQVLGQGDQLQQAVHAGADEVQVVVDELHRGVDFVRDAGGQLPDGLQLLSMAQLHLQAGALAQVHGREHHGGAITDVNDLPAHREQDGHRLALAGLDEGLDAGGAALGVGQQRRDDAVVVRQQHAQMLAQQILFAAPQQLGGLGVGSPDDAAVIDGHQNAGDDIEQPGDIVVGSADLVFGQGDLAGLVGQFILQLSDTSLQRVRGQARVVGSASCDVSHGVPRWHRISSLHEKRRVFYDSRLESRDGRVTAHVSVLLIMPPLA